MALDNCPERTFLTQTYFVIQRDYASKQPPKMGPSYLDRMQQTSGVTLPTVRSYGKAIETNLSGLLYNHKSLGLEDKIYPNGLYHSTIPCGTNYGSSLTSNTELGMGSSIYTGNSVGRGYGGSSLGYNTANSPYQH